MGRPPHKFCWENVDKLPNGKWKCKHCKCNDNNKDWSGGASRILNHLSGQGTDIGACGAVPPHIREEALKRRKSRKRGQNSSASGKGNEASKRPTSEGEGQEVPSEIQEEAMIINSKKRGRNSSASSGEGNDGISSVANTGDLSTNKDSEQERTIDAIVEFFVSRNIVVDAVKDPLFKTFLMRIDQHGFPSCLLQEDSLGIHRSVSNLEHEVNQYMLMVKDSWKTIGCTLIQYNLDGWIGNPSSSKEDGVVYVLYCPKGFIFVQMPDINNMKNHVLNLPIHDVKHQIYHSGHQGCELAKGFDDRFDDGDSCHCAHQRFQWLWKKICTKSGWIRNITQKSENLYDLMLTSNFSGESWEKETAQNDGDATPWSAFTRLRSIMDLEDKIKAWISSYRGNEDVREIVNNKEFWSAGKELLLVVTPLLQFIDLVDTLVPASGYLYVALDKAKHNLKPYYARDASKYQIIKDCLDDFTLMQQEVSTTYLSPFYDWRSTNGSDGPDQIIQDFLAYEMDENLVAELKLYRDNNPFANVPCYDHPVTLWKKYGDDFPLLQKYAIKFLSKPTSCMCSQVRKYVWYCQREDNFILRLNYHMMQEFTELGDRIYEPLQSQFFPEGLESEWRKMQQ